MECFKDNYICCSSVSDLPDHNRTRMMFRCFTQFTLGMISKASNRTKLLF
ncbi:hypothetical protein LINGRAHAP2_LOCUS17044 [Linum grandiflorum]